MICAKSAIDLHKVYIDDDHYNSGHGYAYDRYKIDSEIGAVVVVRPDQCEFRTLYFLRSCFADIQEMSRKSRRLMTLMTSRIFSKASCLSEGPMRTDRPKQNHDLEISILAISFDSCYLLSG
jgi:hypothetical protein